MHFIMLVLIALAPTPSPIATPNATPIPSPTPSPTATASATPIPRFALSVSGSNVFVDQSTRGPGITPPEGPGFIAGSPLSPMSPYDWFSSAPVTPGVSGVAQYLVSGAYHAHHVTLEATMGLAALTGSTTNAAYWGEPLIPNINVHALSRLLPYTIAFPTHAGSDDASLVNANLVAASLAPDDGAWRIRGGYFDLAQTDRFVFAPPALTSVTPSLNVTTAETLGPGTQSIDAWKAAPTTLPLLGVDAVLKHDSATLELTDALLPSLPNTSARLAMGSLVDDRGDNGRYSVQLAHLWTSGDPISTTTYFGTNQQLYPQGRLFSSTLANQVQTLAGARAFFHPMKGWDTLAELGRAWYDDGLATLPGTSVPGNFEHVAVTRHIGDDTAMLEYHRFDGSYASVILPYGTPENVWSVAWSWPGVWLKSTYQMVDNSTIGANREGFHFRYDHPNARLEAHVSVGDWRQIVPETLSQASQQGFVDGFFLLQNNGFGTIGHDRQIGLYAAWHLTHDDLMFDGVDDFLSRDADAGQAIDTVSTHAPQVVGTWQHHFSKSFLAAGGYGRYGIAGTWATTPVDAIYGVGFVGAQFTTGPNTALLVQARHYGLVGLPSMVGGLPPTMAGTALIVDQRINF